ncbi:hypothetical protein [Prevotella koreensis]
MKKILVFIIGLIMMLSVPSIASAECSNVGKRDCALSEIADFNNNAPSTKVVVTSITKPDGTIVMIIHTTVWLNGVIVSDSYEFIIVNKK